VFRLGLDFLSGLNQTKAHGFDQSDKSLDAWLRTRAHHLCASLPTAKDRRLQLLVDEALAVLRDEKLPAIWVHGDFWPGNLLGTGRLNHLSGVVDWEFAESDSIPMIDLFHLMLYTKALAVRKGLGQVFAERFVAGHFDDDEVPFLRKYCEGVGISNRAVWGLAFAGWLEWVSRRVSAHGYIPSWQANEIDSFLDNVTKLPTTAV
jgi:thiamine kinase-like enzyme